MRLLLWQLRYEQKSYWRNPASALFTFAFPLMFLVIFASLNTGATVGFLGGLKYNQYFIPAIIAFGIISATYTQLAITLSLRRQSGALKRARTTPLPAWAVVGGLLLSSVVVAALITVLTTALGMAAYGVTFPGHYAALALDLAVGAMTFTSLGVMLATFVPNADAAPPVVNAVLFPVLFLSGTFFPVSPDATVTKIAELFPVRHFNLATFAAFDPRGPHGITHGFAWQDIAVMAGWGAVCAVIAARRFRWEPKR
ncbi:MAG: type transport system permease protein [Actinomycetota bacterium]|jgi:ABC-2 type transport system permease protein|nr:type transport system permease protein [Actinomycetota bacterium]